MDNMLIQVVGSKRVTLFKPADCDNLYMNGKLPGGLLGSYGDIDALSIGDKSQVINIDKPNFERFPLFLHVTHFTTVLNPGDSIFIPGEMGENYLRNC